MSLEERARRLWPNNPVYQAQWLRIVKAIGPRWLLAKDAEPRPRSYA